MYVPPKFARTPDEAWAIVAEAGAGLLVAQGPHGLQSVLTPVRVSDDRQTLTAHLAKANGWWQSLADGTEVLALFTVASAYVSPRYYPSRVANPGVVPTWNYVSAEVRGTITIHHDELWLREQVTAVTDQFEGDRPDAWHVSDSDPDYVRKQLSAIVGVEIAVTGITAAAKLSQNRPQDHDAVRAHLAEGRANEQNVAGRMHLD